jgi:hypothetical protein
MIEMRLMSENGSRELASWVSVTAIPPAWRLAVERGCIVQARTGSRALMNAPGHLPCTGYHYHKHGSGKNAHAGWHEHSDDNQHDSNLLHTHPHPATAQAAPVDITSSPSAADALPAAKAAGGGPAANDYNAYDPTSV